MPDETPNSLKSHQYAKIVDLLSEGSIKGVVGGAKGVFLDGTPMIMANGAAQFPNTKAQFVNGYPNQAVMSGFASQQSEIAVGVQLKNTSGAQGGGTPVTRTILNTDCDRCRVTVSVPSLQFVNTETGDISGAAVSYNIRMQNNGGGFKHVAHIVIDGKTNTTFQRQTVFALPPPGPWDIQLIRYSVDSEVAEHQNDTYWDSYTEIIDDKINYAHSACVGLQFDSEQFQTLPRRTYLVDGLRILIPNNYDPYTRAYSGVWNGLFKLDWSNNPAWVLFDLLTRNRYGLGNFISLEQIDRWALYKVAQWCDGVVQDGKGGFEWRWLCNGVITTQQEAFDLLGQITGIFRGFTYWSDGQMIAVADQPANPVMQYTNANVIDGQFTYSGTDIKARHTMVRVPWNDPELLGQPRLAIVEDQPAISRYGIQPVDVPAICCDRESQALRTGKWTLYTEQYEGEAVQFRTGLEAAWVRPGDVIRVSDALIAGKRMGGRVVGYYGGSDQHIEVDQRPPMSDGKAYQLSCVVGVADSSYGVQTRTASLSANPNTIFISEPFTGPPTPDSVFVLSDPEDLQPTLWRVLSVRQAERDQYEISGIRHFPEKWDYVERNLAFSDPDVSDVPTRPEGVRNLNLIEYLVQTSPISVGVRATLSWTASFGAVAYDVNYRKANGNWTRLRTDRASAADLVVSEGTWEFQVTPVSAIGLKGPTSTISRTITGRSDPPAPPKQFRLKVSDGVALFEWAPATELDVIIGGHFELRHSSRTTGATWVGAQVVVPSIPGAATSVEAVYRTGTWLLRTFDIMGTPSATAAAIIAMQPDGRYREFARICENPDWLGDHNYTEILQPQQWLVLGQTGGLWDEQMANMDDWPDVDVLVEGMPDPPESAPRHGWYVFDNRIDAGGVFPVRFSADILAFPYADPDEFIDSRLDDCDDWEDWDNVSADLGGEVTLYIRMTDENPANASAVWTDWQIFSPIEYTARGFEFRADLDAPAGQNIAVETLCITADLKMKMDSAEDVPYPAATTHVNFTVKFYLVPSVVVTVQNALATDTIQVLNKTRTGFDVNITNAGSQVTRIFDWQARGF